MNAEEVISKLKDDGDFDRLRLKIVRQLKQNETLRNNIISAVKQSAALNRPGAENMIPRQLCDAIHDEIRENVMNQISEGLWEIIRSGDSMKTEIRETVQSVYDKLLNPHRKIETESASSSGQASGKEQIESSGSVKASGDYNGTMSDGNHIDSRGCFQHNHTVANNHNSESETQQSHPSNKSEELTRGPRNDVDPSPKKDGSSPPPSFSSSGKHKRASDADDEDLDIPPGFG
ncbi:uncharacterized protein LOC130803883 [Amaranthus tricolor]|uniref:uncharacterized protein LOC130803883 n=1 Tax=Amaranthus tricolor TaxID=29722 RepID=UPI00258AC290|nr:uncharacterized protein LOC130803883 [Amaranthus tricolor]